MPKLGRKFWMGLLGSGLIAAVYYIASQYPVITPFVGWVVSAIAGLTGVTVASIAHEDSQQAHAAASVQIAQAMAQAPAEPAAAPDNTTTVNVAPATAGGVS
jgi:hypothetical protein